MTDTVVTRQVVEVFVIASGVPPTTSVTRQALEVLSVIPALAIPRRISIQVHTVNDSG